MPLLRNADKSKISKRKNPAARLTWFLEQGYLPEALLNFLGLLGYSLPDGQEVFSFEEMSRTFDWGRISTVGPVFDLDKLGWLNGHYVRELVEDDFARGPCRSCSGPDWSPTRVRGARRGCGSWCRCADAGGVLSELPDLVRFLFVPEEDFAVEPAAAAKALCGEGRRCSRPRPTRWRACRTGRRSRAGRRRRGPARGRPRAQARARPTCRCGSPLSGAADRAAADESIALLGRERALRRLRPRRAAAEQRRRADVR
jgi:glutamyl-tRNA synthetase